VSKLVRDSRRRMVDRAIALADQSERDPRGDGAFVGRWKVVSVFPTMLPGDCVEVATVVTSIRTQFLRQKKQMEGQGRR
jgi:hypothetical protein